ncbi:SdiA-regulated family protein [Mucilaginibacter sp. Bleaf8]|uniref:SdiA-regulated family protein n=1 Tax=Mucilaginibacter sp. Bleaf8 TaxID=2834430 RepID=UPI001BCBF461|nr:SdiA-regulated family protein [Mucilaginibacter sp. Bleaf8]MBS7564635.1 SdiA-regulated family protein [Mucilaginibacter sp. Bleaf8]
MIKTAIAPLLAIVIGMTGISSCGQSNQQVYKSPVGYNFREPERHGMPEDLLEISGIAFNKLDSKTVYAIQDEDGRLFYGRVTAPKFQKTKFGKHGDYEDIAICNDRVIVLKSNGKLYEFPLSEINGPEVANVREFDDLLPPGEYESMYADEATKKVYVLCKNCDDEKTSQSSSGYIFNLQPDGNLQAAGNFKIEVDQIKQITGDKKIKFRPSAMALHPRTKQWFIISAVNNLLVVTDANFQVKAAYTTNSKHFRQPEGMAFNKRGDLFISNEGDELNKGNILEFQYFPNKK